MRRFVVALGVVVALVMSLSMPATARTGTLTGRSSQYQLIVTFDAAHLPAGSTMSVSRLIVSREHPVEPSDEATDVAVRLYNEVQRYPVNPIPAGKDTHQVWTVDSTTDNYAAANVCIQLASSERACEPAVFHIDPGDPSLLFGGPHWHLWIGQWELIPWTSGFYAPTLSLGPSACVVTYASGNWELSMMGETDDQWDC